MTERKPSTPAREKARKALDLKSPPSHPVTWAVETTKKTSDGETVSIVYVDAQTAYQAWILAAPQLPGDPGFNECTFEVVGDD